MPKVAVERTVGETRRALLKGLWSYNTEKLGKHKYKRFAISLREKGAIVGGVTGEVWINVLFIQMFWIEARFRGKDYGTKLMAQIENAAREFGAVQAYVDTMSFQAPGFYRSCGYTEFGSLDGYPQDTTRHWFTKKL